jgi:hypothetical protein
LVNKKGNVAVGQRSIPQQYETLDVIKAIEVLTSYSWHYYTKSFGKHFVLGHRSGGLVACLG